MAIKKGVPDMEELIFTKVEHILKCFLGLRTIG